MGSKFVEVRGDVFEQFLSSKGFIKNVIGNEIVYERAHTDEPNIMIRVYTSIKKGSTTVRDVGKDAIRVSAFFKKEDRSFGLYKSRVYRVTSEEEVFKRVYERMREAYKRCNQWLMSQGYTITPVKKG